MANIFGGGEPPSWLQRMAQPADTSVTARVIGELVGGVTNAFQTASKKQEEGQQTTWLKELPGSIAAARINIADPLGALKVQQVQLGLAAHKLQMDAQQSLIDSRKQKMQMMEHDQSVLPKWLQDHPTWESRQDAEPPQLFTSEAQRMFRDVQLGDAGNIKHKAIVEGINAYSKSVAELQKIDPIAAAPFATKIGKVPTPEDEAALGAALDKAQAKRAEAIKPKVETVDLGGGKTMAVIYNPKTGRFEPPKPSKEEEVKMRARIEVAKKKVEQLNAEYDKPENQGVETRGRIAKRLRQAQEELDKLLGEPQAEPKAAPQKPPATDPLGLF